MYLSLLDPLSHRVIWSREIENVDIRSWLPGDDWDEQADRYRIPAKTYNVQSTMLLPGNSDLPTGEYILALSIPDPYSGELGIRLAIRNYFEGGYHPLGIIAYGTTPTGSPMVSAESFIDPMGQ
jgi:hypothetical protein